MPFVDGGRAEARTLGPLIKSQLLYQLSYTPPLLFSFYTLLLFENQVLFFPFLIFLLNLPNLMPYFALPLRTVSEHFLHYSDSKQLN